MTITDDVQKMVASAVSRQWWRVGRIRDLSPADVRQECIVQVLKATYDPARKIAVSTFITRVCRNTMIDLSRKASRKSRPARESQIGEGVESPEVIEVDPLELEDFARLAEKIDRKKGSKARRTFTLGQEVAIAAYAAQSGASARVVAGKLASEMARNALRLRRSPSHDRIRDWLRRHAETVKALS